MKQWLYICITLLLSMLIACGNQESQTSMQESSYQEISSTEAKTKLTDSTLTKREEENEEANMENENTMKVTVGNTVFWATLADNSSAQALRELLAKEPLTIDMSDYANMEKVGPIGQSLPENNEQITTEAGDIILYLGDSLVIYYDTNSWNFTRIGKINDVTAEELKDALGSGNVTVTFELKKDE